MADVTMPQLGETVTEGTITRWMKAVGEPVNRDEPLFEVSTDKVDSEVPAPASGTLSEILVQEGETVAVGARLAVIADGGAPGGETAAPEAQAAAQPAEAPPAPVAPVPPAPQGAQAAAPAAPAPPAAPAAAQGPPPAPPAAPPAPPTAPQTTAPFAPPGSPLPPQGQPQPAAAPPVAPPPPPPPSPPASPFAAPSAPSSPPPMGPPPAPGAPVAPAPGGVTAPPAAAGEAPPPPPPAGYVAASAGAPVGGQPAQAGSAQPGAAGQSHAGDGALLLSPVVRRLLDENGISPGDVTGTGLGGRITREDVLAYIDARHRPGGTTQPASATSPSPGPSAPAASAPSAPAAPSTPAGSSAPSGSSAPAGPQAPPQPAPASAGGGAQPVAASQQQPVAAGATTARIRPANDRVEAFSNIRRRTAEHMVRSKATSPHAYIAYEVDFENVERVRRIWNERFTSEEGFSLTYLPFIARATVEALREFPALNASVDGDALVVHQEINLGIAVDLQFEGLIVPVVHRAEEVTLRGVARRIRDLADRARSRQLTADDIAGGTFSITNDGPFGTYFTVPIINQPQVAILATDGIRRRPVVVTLPDGSETLAIHSIGVIGLSWDHRAVDGAYVSSFLRRVAQVLGTRDWAAEL